MLLSKGLEIEIYTGTPAGEIIGLSDQVVKALEGFVREPDNRNVEYTTPPCCSYESLLCAILQPRLQLRQFLKTLGNYTLIPGSTLSLGDASRFFRSDPQNPYHAYIEKTYGTDVVTASVHINIGIEDPEILMRACRLMRLEAPLILALSAASPFLDGRVTGSHSRRWQVFPKTPAQVPLFTSHQHFIDWTNEQLRLGTMQNVRHLWSSVRPNGDRRPYSLNRLELRICDLVIHPLQLLAIVAFVEARIQQLMAQPHLDPLKSSQLNPARLLEITDANEQLAAQSSLDATLNHWRTGQPIQAVDWIQEIYTEVYPFAKQAGFACFLSPLQKLLREGNQAQRWLQAHHQGQPLEMIIQKAIAEAETLDQELAQYLCEPAALVA
ncbi:putative glutamate--cysteine ligase [Picosynechococcus sp. PCC 7003]|uniref:glutamate--cysteine ligase n=1 Tax=Picosynechococcus sp. PCC 7003 TaxID=374981 RepID=UPI000810E952|nr:glutamate--cysteine ligase [Picosynechococcus sp. PCC 7003]ANV85364.1 putative glutamate--cysteine ligase [Picosynechococcus sp. PCC 7003]